MPQSDKKKKPDPKLSPWTEAMKEAPNVLGLTGCAAMSMATLNPLPLLVGVVAEAAYLLMVPDTSWYRNLLKRREKVLSAVAAMEYRESLKKDILPNLPPELADRYRRLESTKTHLETDFDASDYFYGDILTKLDHLLESFLGFAQKDIQFRAYLLKLGGEVRVSKGSSERERDSNKNKSRKFEPPAAHPRDEQWVKHLVAEIDSHYQEERASIEAQLKEDDSNTEAVLRKRGEVLQRRSDYLHKIGNTLINLQHQMCLLEDTFGLISDEIRARSPKEVLSDVEDVVTQTNLMNEVLDQFDSSVLA